MASEDAELTKYWRVYVPRKKKNLFWLENVDEK